MRKLWIQMYENYLMDKYNFLNDNSNDKIKSWGTLQDLDVKFFRGIKWIY